MPILWLPYSKFAPPDFLMHGKDSGRKKPQAAQADEFFLIIRKVIRY
jgi:hypothetical protein